MNVEISDKLLSGQLTTSAILISGVGKRGVGGYNPVAEKILKIPPPP